MLAYQHHGLSERNYLSVIYVIAMKAEFYFIISQFKEMSTNSSPANTFPNLNGFTRKPA